MISYDDWKTEDVEGDAAHAAWERWYDDHYDEKRAEWCKSYREDNPGGTESDDEIIKSSSVFFEDWMASEYERYQRWSD